MFTRYVHQLRIFLDSSLLANVHNVSKKRHIGRVCLLGGILGIVLSAISLASGADKALADYFLDPANVQIWQRFRDITQIGLAEPYFAIALISWFIGHSKKYTESPFKELELWGRDFLICLLASGAIVHLVKFIVGRQRPHKTPLHDPFVFEPFNIHWHWQSFPSGHSQVMAVVAVFMSLLFPKLKWFFGIFAALICFSRVGTGDHFLSDTIMGATVGFLTALVVLSALHPNNEL